jgi:hypothetical protein
MSLALLLLQSPLFTKCPEVEFYQVKQAADRYKMMLDHFPDLVLKAPAKIITYCLSIPEETLIESAAVNINKLTDRELVIN